MGCRRTALADILGLKTRAFVPYGGSRWSMLPPRDLAEICSRSLQCKCLKQYLIP